MALGLSRLAFGFLDAGDVYASRDDEGRCDTYHDDDKHRDERHTTPLRRLLLGTLISISAIVLCIGVATPLLIGAGRTSLTRRTRAAGAS